MFYDLLHLRSGLLRIPLLWGLARVCGEVELPEWVLPIIGEEWQHAGCRLGMVISAELGQMEPGFPIVLQVVDVCLQVLL